MATRRTPSGMRGGHLLDAEAWRQVDRDAARTDPECYECHAAPGTNPDTCAACAWYVEETELLYGSEPEGATR